MTRIKLIVLLLISAVAITACSGSTNSDTSGSIIEANTTQNITQSVTPERKAELQGEVKSIIGNEITVYKVLGEQLELTEEEKEKRREERQNLSTEEKQQLRVEKTNVSNETQTFVVPVGVPIITTQSTSAGPEIIRMDLADIKKGSLLKIWFEVDGNSEEAEFVQIMNSGG